MSYSHKDVINYLERNVERFRGLVERNPDFYLWQKCLAAAEKNLQKALEVEADEAQLL